MLNSPHILSCLELRSIWVIVDTLGNLLKGSEENLCHFYHFGGNAAIFEMLQHGTQQFIEKSVYEHASSAHTYLSKTKAEQAIKTISFLFNKKESKLENEKLEDDIALEVIQILAHQLS